MIKRFITRIRIMLLARQLKRRLKEELGIDVTIKVANDAETAKYELIRRELDDDL